MPASPPTPTDAIIIDFEPAQSWDPPSVPASATHAMVSQPPSSTLANADLIVSDDDDTMQSFGVPPPRPTSIPPPPPPKSATAPRRLSGAAAAEDAEDWNDDFAEEEETTGHLIRPGPVSEASPPSLSSRSWKVRAQETQGDPLCGRSIANDKYVLESVIGAGAVGVVFKAVHVELDRTVAIKVLNPRLRGMEESLEVFHREARAACLLEHPHIARLYDYGREPDGLVYIVMEFLSGYSLGKVLSTRKSVALPRAVEIMRQICGALAFAHDRGIVHRDAKPDNVVLVPQQDELGAPIEVVKVCDFGLAALGPAVADAESRAYIAGTPEYVAPEQITGRAVSPATDVYTCGVMLYEMLTGRLPFAAAQPVTLMLEHLKAHPRALGNDVHPAYAEVVMRCLAKKPAHRYPDARALYIALRRASEIAG